MPLPEINTKYFVGRTIGNSFSLERQLGPTAAASARRANAQGALYELQNFVAQSVKFDVTVDMSGLVTGIAAGVTGEVGKIMEAFSKSLKEAYSQRYGMQQLHNRLGRGAQQAVQSAYSRNHGKRSSYRQNDKARYAGNRLGSALAQSNFFLAQPDGLMLINKAQLDRSAKQWYRLNFGAGMRGRGLGDSGTFPLQFSEGSVNLSLRNFRPSRDFSMPTGVFFQGLDQGELAGKIRSALEARGRQKAGHHITKAQASVGALNFLYRPGAGRLQPFSGPLPLNTELRGLLKGYLVGASPTLGIRGSHFFDAGLEYLAKNLPPAYLNLFDQWLEESVTKSKGPAFKAGLTGPVAREMRIQIRDTLKT